MAQRSRSRRGLPTWLAGSTTPLFILDVNRKVLFFNHGCEALSGWNAGDVVGQVCDYVSEPDPSQVESLTGFLCPPPEVFEGSEQSVSAFLLKRSGEKLGRLVQFIPLMDEEHHVERVLGAVFPLSEQNQSKSQGPDRKLHAELAAIRADLRKHYEVTSLVGRSAAFGRILRQIALAKQSAAPVHFEGERGTGREHIARMIHYQGPDRLRAFVPVDCRRLTADQVRKTWEYVLTEVVQSEIPHLRPGVIYLRDVDQLPADLQLELVDRWSESDPPALRLMSATTQPLEAAVEADRLTADCFELLTSLVIHVPPLRRRMEDFDLLAQDVLESHNRDRDVQVVGFTEEVWNAFRRYNWPGNQDELQAVILEARQACSGKLITLADLPFRFRAGQDAQTTAPIQSIELEPLAEHLDQVEREHIRRALEVCGQNKSQAASRLGITRPKLYRRMQQLGLADK